MPTHPAFTEMLNQGPSLSWILEVRTGRYLFMSNHVERLTGQVPENFTQGGMACTNRLLHPDDAAPVWQLMHTVWEFLLALPAGQRQTYGFSCDYRIRREDGTYLRLLEQNRVLQTDSHGNITHLLGTGTDITSWKESEMLVASITSLVDDSRLVCTSADGMLQPRTPLSRREKEVVKLIVDGYSSKQIADRLYLSLHTVNTHRRNIMGKTQHKNTHDLVRFASQNGII
jgi:DNA-binding CsgD family transcriptional regulator